MITRISDLPYPISLGLGGNEHDDVMTWERFPNYWPNVRESSGNFWCLLTKGYSNDQLCYSHFAVKLNELWNNVKNCQRFETLSRSSDITVIIQWHTWWIGSHLSFYSGGSLVNGLSHQKYWNSFPAEQLPCEGCIKWQFLARAGSLVPRVVK